MSNVAHSIIFSLCTQCEMCQSNMPVGVRLSYLKMMMMIVIIRKWIDHWSMNNIQWLVVLTVHHYCSIWLCLCYNQNRNYIWLTIEMWPVKASQSNCPLCSRSYLGWIVWHAYVHHHPTIDHLHLFGGNGPFNWYIGGVGYLTPSIGNRY